MTGRRQPVDSSRPVYLVTGAGGTLGSAFCRRFSNRYSIVAVWHRRRPVAPSQGQKLIDPLCPERSLGVNRHPVFDIRADLRSDTDIERLVEKVMDRFGRIDVVVNAAVAGNWSPLLNGHAVTDDFVAALRVNVVAPLAVVAEVTRQCWEADVEGNRAWNRNVVNVSSSAGLYVYPGYGQGIYSAAKAALNILTRHLAAELEHLGVRANAIAPDSFPGRVPIPRVLDGVARLAEGGLTGQVLLQLPDGVDYTLAQ